MKKIYTLMFAAVLSASLCATAAAQNAAPVSTADSVALLDTRVNRLNGDVAALDGTVTKLDKFISKLPKVSGFMQLLYTFDDNRGASTTSEFRVRRARVTLAGDIYKGYADYNFMAEFAGSVQLLDAFVRLTPWKQFNVQAGSFRPAFTIENYFYGATSMELIDYPQIVTRMTTLGDLTGGTRASAAGRDLGIQAYGGFFNKNGYSVLQYYAGIFNGNGIDYKNINSVRDFAGMIRINPVKELALVGSVYVGQYAPGGAHTYAVRNRWSGGFMFDNKKWFARGEYIGGVTGNILPGSKLHTDGAYLMAGVWFCDRKVAPVLRAEYYTYNTELRDGTTDIYYTAGVDYRPWKYLRFQVNYTAKTYSYNLPTDKAGHRSMGNQVMVMLTGLF